ncbi:MAG: GAF domain-containing protein [Polyangiaceae bacterium]|nr:GAF domain-containing protein [Polyangiaceae bacterium]
MDGREADPISVSESSHGSPPVSWVEHGLGAVAEWLLSATFERFDDALRGALEETARLLHVEVATLHWSTGGATEIVAGGKGLDRSLEAMLARAHDDLVALTARNVRWFADPSSVARSTEAPRFGGIHALGVLRTRSASDERGLLAVWATDARPLSHSERAQMAIVGELFASGLARRRAEARGDDLARFHRVVADVAGSLASAETDALDATLEGALGSVAEAMGLKRAAIFLLDAETARFRLAYASSPAVRFQRSDEVLGQVVGAHGVERLRSGRGLVATPSSEGEGGVTAVVRPILLGGKLLGALVAESGPGRPTDAAALVRYQCIADVVAQSLARRPAAPTSSPRPLSATEMRELERVNLLRALEATSWRIGGPSGAAQRIGVSPSTLRDRIRAHGLQSPMAPSWRSRRR